VAETLREFRYEKSPSIRCVK